MKLSVLIRCYPDSSDCSVWLIEANGPTRQSWLHGRASKAKALELAEALGLKVEIQESQMAGMVAEPLQQELF